ncbi:MAG: fasciclin domain-containing protein, partial [Imperialibacter sp.]
MGNLWQAIEEAKELSIFENAIVVAGLQPLFEEQGPYTVFAPTNEAMLTFFEEFGFTEGLANLSPQDLQIVVLYHVVDDRLFLKNFGEELGYPTLFNGFEALIARLNSDVSINGVS